VKAEGWHVQSQGTLHQGHHNFDSSRKSPNKKPAIKDLNVAFKNEMTRLGIKSNGRPRKTLRFKRKHPKYTTNSGDFLKAFAWSPEHKDQSVEQLTEDNNCDDGNSENFFSKFNSQQQLQPFITH
jgi:hypothetical protein